MELYNEEQKPLRKKDKEAYYYKDDGSFSRVPGMFDSKEKIFAFVMSCAKHTIPNITRDIVEEIWEDAEEKKTIILDALKQLKKEHEYEADYFKSAAYGRAISQIQKLQIPLLSGEQAQKLKGVGKGIAAHIDEILSSGRLKSQEEREEYRIKRQKVVENFTHVWGVTSKIAGEWYDQGYQTLEEIPDSELTDQQRAGIKYYEEIKQPISREEAEDIGDEIINQLNGKNGITHVNITGPYRRGAPEIDVIEVLISVGESQKLGKPLLGKIVNVLEKSGLIADVSAIKFAPKKIMGIVLSPNEVHRRFDIILVSSDARGSALIHTTGPRSFVNHLKELASQQGYKLNEDGLFKLNSKADEDEKIPVPTEEDVFSALKIPYTYPEDRF